MSSLSLRAYAKINLLLTIGQKLPNNYHLLKSVMQSVSLADELIIKPAAKLELVGDLTALKEQNLVFKAAKALQAASKTNYGAQIELKKKIPVAAGLGGGSADAAATLLGLNQLWDLNFSLPQLKSIAATIGSDVPFCLEGGTKLVTGWGQKVEPLAFLKITNLWLVKIHATLSTAKVYQTFAKINCKPQAKSNNLWRILQLPPAKILDELASYLTNDLEEAVFQLLPAVKRVKEKLLASGVVKACLVSGSGPTLIAWFQQKVTNKDVKEIIGHEVEVWEVETKPRGVDINLVAAEAKVLNAS